MSEYLPFDFPDWGDNVLIFNYGSSMVQRKTKSFTFNLMLEWLLTKSIRLPSSATWCAWSLPQPRCALFVAGESRRWWNKNHSLVWPEHGGREGQGPCCNPLFAGAGRRIATCSEWHFSLFLYPSNWRLCHSACEFSLMKRLFVIVFEFVHEISRCKTWSNQIVLTV